jgi:hypothetical protein
VWKEEGVCDGKSNKVKVMARRSANEENEAQIVKGGSSSSDIYHDGVRTDCSNTSGSTGCY